MTVPLEQTETARANDALRLIGEPPIVSLDDRKRAAARQCRAAFATVRDQLLRAAPWQFAKATAQPASIGASPDGLWLYRYAMPDDCLAVRSIRDADNEAWEVASIGSDGDPKSYVHTNLATPLIFYTRRVSNPAQWDELFAECFALKLAATINPAIGRDKSQTSGLLQLAESRLLRAQQRDARERAPDRITRETSWVRARWGGRR